MPRIVAYIKEMLEEEKYGSAYIEKLPIRLQELNSAQLIGMYSHLSKVKKGAALKLWENANGDIMSKMEAILAEKRTAAEAKEKKREDALLRLRQARATARAKKLEEKRVIENIEDNARMRAVEEVKEEEYKRKAAERIELMKKVVAGEALQKMLMIRGSVFFVIVTVVLAVAVKNVLYVLAGVFLAACITGYLFYWGYKATIVLPLVVTEDEIQDKIRIRGEDLRLKAMNALKVKENEFNARVLRERQERRAIREQRRAIKVAERAEQQATYAALLQQAGVEVAEEPSESLAESQPAVKLMMDGTGRKGREKSVKFAPMPESDDEDEDEDEDEDDEDETSGDDEKDKRDADKDKDNRELEVLEFKVASVGFMDMDYLPDLRGNVFAFFAVIETKDAVTTGPKFISDIMLFDHAGGDGGAGREGMDELLFSSLTHYPPSDVAFEDFIAPVVQKIQRSYMLRQKQSPGHRATKQGSHVKSAPPEGSEPGGKSSWKFVPKLGLNFGAKIIPNTASEEADSKEAMKLPSPIVTNQQQVELSDENSHSHGRRLSLGTGLGGQLVEKICLLHGQKLKVSLIAVYRNIHPPHVLVHSTVCDATLDLNDFRRGIGGRHRDRLVVEEDLRRINMFSRGSLRLEGGIVSKEFKGPAEKVDPHHSPRHVLAASEAVDGFSSVSVNQALPSHETRSEFKAAGGEIHKISIATISLLDFRHLDFPLVSLKNSTDLHLQRHEQLYLRLSAAIGTGDASLLVAHSSVLLRADLTTEGQTSKLVIPNMKPVSFSFIESSPLMCTGTGKVVVTIQFEAFKGEELKSSAEVDIESSMSKDSSQGVELHASLLPAAVSLGSFSCSSTDFLQASKPPTAASHDEALACEGDQADPVANSANASVSGILLSADYLPVCRVVVEFNVEVVDHIV